MTVLACAVGADGTWLGADGHSQAGDLVVATATKKWNVSPDGLWAFAGAGEATFDSVLLDGGGADLWPGAGEQAAFDGRAALARSMREKLSAVDGFQLVRHAESVFGDYGWEALIATDGYVWRLCSDLRSFDKPLEGVYWASGSGADYAIGAMSALVARNVTSAEELVCAGVAAACRMCTTCGGEIVVERLGHTLPHNESRDGKDHTFVSGAAGDTRWSATRRLL